MITMEAVLVAWTILAPLGLGINLVILFLTLSHGLSLLMQGRNGVNRDIIIWHAGEEIHRVLAHALLVFFSWRAWVHLGDALYTAPAIELIPGGLAFTIGFFVAGVWSVYWRRRVAKVAADRERAEAARERD